MKLHTPTAVLFWYCVFCLCLLAITPTIAATDDRLDRGLTSSAQTGGTKKLTRGKRSNKRITERGDDDDESHEGKKSANGGGKKGRTEEQGDDDDDEEPNEEEEINQEEEKEENNEEETGEETEPPEETGTDGCSLARFSSSATECAPNPSSSPLGICAGIRGNGIQLWAHYGSLARIVEDFGPIEGAAGASSGSLTSLILDSIQSNPLVKECNAKCCSPMEQRARIAFLLKSVTIPEMSNYISPTTIFFPLVIQLFGGNFVGRLTATSDVDEQAIIVNELVAVLESFSDLVSDEAIDLIKTSPQPAFHAIDIVNATLSGGTDTDPLIFLRPYLFDADGVANLSSIPADFFAGLFPANLTAMELLLQDCAEASMGLNWVDTSVLLTSSGDTCGQKMETIFSDFTSSDPPPRRIDEPIGGNGLPVVVGVSVAGGDLYAAWENGVEDYRSLNFPVDWDVDFADVRVGYFGDQESLATIGGNIGEFSDTKSQRYVALGNKTTTWREAITTSSTEPSLGSGVLISEAMVGLGGWIESSPAQVLKAMGCNKVILINRPDDPGLLALRIAGALQATQEDIDDLYDYSDSASSWTTSLLTQDATYCGDWFSVDQNNPNALFETGWDAPLLVFDDCLSASLNRDESNLTLAGCTPLVEFAE